MTKYDYEKAMLQQISDVAWLVHRGEQRLGILNKDVQDHYFYINGKELVQFNNDVEVKEHFGNIKLFDEQISEAAQKQDTYYIRGYAVDYPDPYALEEGHPDYNPDLPLYTKIEGNAVYYAAGYYCINFEKGWKQANGPKLATLEKYGYEGPFKTEMEMRQRLRALNKQRRKNEQSA
jgi:hypothetical protein